MHPWRTPWKNSKRNRRNSWRNPCRSSLNINIYCRNSWRHTWKNLDAYLDKTHKVFMKECEIFLKNSRKNPRTNFWSKTRRNSWKFSRKNWTGISEGIPEATPEVVSFRNSFGRNARIFSEPISLKIRNFGRNSRKKSQRKHKRNFIRYSRKNLWKDYRRNSRWIFFN